MYRTKAIGRVRGTSQPTQAAARELRRSLTPAEQALWRALQGRRLAGLKFRRQHAVGPFVLDFYCPSAKLVVEVDGPIHDTRAEQDAARTEHMQAFGYRVLRFRNEEVLTNLDVVLERIAQEAAPLHSSYSG